MGMDLVNLLFKLNLKKKPTQNNQSNCYLFTLNNRPQYNQQLNHLRIVAFQYACASLENI